ncbi:MAG TPA: polyprenyl synthetase family protein [Clostridia bacterium]
MKSLLHNPQQITKKIIFDVSSNPDIKAIEIELSNELSESKGQVREMFTHIQNAGGKRIRPLLVLYSGMIFHGKREELIKAASAAEIIHMATLIHDDIIDSSTLRRSKPSVNSVWGNTKAVLCGDSLFAKAFSILAKDRLIESMDFMVEAIQNMCDGEIEQANDRFNPDIDLETYYTRIRKKTAIFLECCCKSGAAAAGAGREYINLIGDFGLNLGIAFQIIDDVMDYYGDEEKMGKPKWEDLHEGNITLPLIMLLKEPEHGSYLRKALKGKNISPIEKEYVKTCLNKSDIYNQCCCFAKNHIIKAKENLKFLPESKYVNYLDNLADLLYQRTN